MLGVPSYSGDVQGLLRNVGIGWQSAREIATLPLVLPNPLTLRDGWSPYQAGNLEQPRISMSRTS